MTANLLSRLQGLKAPSNEIDMAFEIATFEPDDTYKAVRANDAGTKLVYTLADGRTVTHWAWDHTLTQDRRDRCIAILTALEARKNG